jgi:enoyl-[acyl-carrier protein] reductase I
MEDSGRSLEGQHFVVTGVANEWSLAWAVVSRLAGQGASCHLACVPANRKRVDRLVRDLGAPGVFVYELDVRSDESVAGLVTAVRARAERITGLLHSIAFADVEELEAGLLETSRAGFALAMDISVYSLASLCRAFAPALGPESSVVAMTYHGSQKVIPGYGIMGVAKAALESLVRYLASELGARGVRVNSVSAGPVLTLAASAFPDIEAKIERAAKASPLRRAIRQDDVAGMVEYLFSKSSSAVSGQCMYVDAGLSTMGAAG